MQINKLKNLLVNVVKPVIEEYFLEKNPELMAKWDNNCCLQTAVIVSNILDSSLDKSNYSVHAYEGLFKDIMFDQRVDYNHAWVYVQNLKDVNKSVFIDIARHHKENVVFITNKNSYDNTHKDYKHQKLVEAIELDYKKYLTLNEYYTGVPGIVNYKKILQRITNQDCLISKN